MIVSLSFRAQTGKDTVGDYLVKQYGFEKVAFADSLKRAAMEVFGFSYEQVYGNLKEVVDPRWGFTPRAALQKMGTECMRNHFDKEIWVKSLRAKMLQYPEKNFCIVDARFPDEISAVKSWGGKVIKVHRDLSGVKSGNPSHESEVALENYNDWDFVIENNGTFEDLYRKVDNLMNTLR